MRKVAIFKTRGDYAAVLQELTERINIVKVYLDDERIAPDGWHQVRWPDEAIELLKTGVVTELSLDHDLGDDEKGTGYDVILWLEEQVITNGFRPPVLSVHSANASARVKMEAGIASIERHTNLDQS